MRLPSFAIFATFAYCLNFHTTFAQTLTSSEIQTLSKMSVGEQVKYFGYPFESHVVTTKDGYVLTLHRLPGGKTGNSTGNNRNKTAVLLQHGFLSFSGDWLLTGPNSSLGYMLADAGYDVWLSNSRGNTYSNRNVFVNRLMQPGKFYNYSFQDLGTGDLPAVIDYILDLKQQPSLCYVGHSQGTSAYYVLMSELPEYNAKVRVSYSLAPIAYFRTVRTLIYLLAAQLRLLLEAILPLLDVFHLGRDQLLFYMTDQFCVINNQTLELCLEAILTQVGPEQTGNFELQLLRLFLANSPEISSTKEAYHYLQLYSPTEYIFRKYDYGLGKNIAYYNSPTPPSFNLTKVTSPVNLVYSCDDYLSSCLDVVQLGNVLPNATLHEIANYNHMDYLWSTTTGKFVGDYIIGDLPKYLVP